MAMAPRGKWRRGSWEEGFGAHCYLEGCREVGVSMNRECGLPVLRNLGRGCGSGNKLTVEKPHEHLEAYFTLIVSCYPHPAPAATP